ncbi:hypothetical protein AYI68_g3981 [Smittium mucronatum]|uniref:Uncharacterized protein n=1 Tax=Smittium mucronatum TaxID=133383 RepID=A0A1R0GYE9_9FUNG|nr:hypothetical protein AYI68_g3981 [Smittium mucronatum]
MIFSNQLTTCGSCEKSAHPHQYSLIFILTKVFKGIQSDYVPEPPSRMLGLLFADDKAIMAEFGTKMLIELNKINFW